MDSSKIYILVLGMALVTYIPRAIPAVLMDKLHCGGNIEKFLQLIPYTAMSALIFPGVFSADSQNQMIGIVGAAVAGVLAWRKFPVMVCVLGAIAADFLIYSFI